MAKRLDKKESAQRSALAIAERLAAIPRNISERQWTMDAGVSPSFFSNLRGTPTKPPSDPSVDQLRQILSVRGVTLSEFFLPEASSRVVRVPTQRDVERAFERALAGLPAKQSARPAYLASVVAGALGLPASLPPTEDEADRSEVGAPEEVAPPREATKQQ